MKTATTLSPKEIIERLKLEDARVCGSEIKARCPFEDHRDSVPSFMLNFKKGVWHCFGCGRSGKLSDILEDYEEILKNPTKYVMGKITHSPQRNYSFTLSEVAKRFKLRVDYSLWMRDMLFRKYDKLLHDFSKDRVKEVVRKYKLFVTDKGLVFPYFNDVGKVVGLKLRRFFLDKRNPRFYNILPFSSNRWLFGYRQAISNNFDYVILVEGEWKVLFLSMIGLNAIATSGTSTGRNGSILPKLICSSFGKVYIWFDPDEAGRSAAQFWKKKLCGIGAMVGVVFANKEVDEMGEESVRNLVKSTRLEM